MKELQNLITYKDVFFLLAVVIPMSAIDLLYVFCIATVLTSLLNSDSTIDTVVHLSNYFPDTEYVKFVLISFILMGLLKITLGNFLMMTQNNFLSNKKLEIRRKLYDVLFAKVQDNDNFKYSLYQRAYIRDTHEFIMGYVNPIIYIVTESLVFFSIFIALIIFNPLSSILLIFLIILSWSIFYLSNYFLNKSDDTGVEQQLMSSFNDAMRARKEVKLTNFGALIRNRIKKIEDDSKSILTTRLTLFVLPKNISEVVLITFFVVVIYYLQSSGVMNNNISFIIGSSAAIAYRLLPSLGRLVASFQQLKLSTYYTNALKNLLKNEYDYEKTHNGNFYNSFKNISIKNALVGPKGSPLIKIDELTINSGEIIGIIGPSGAGKTMLLDTICTLRPLLSGKLTIDNNHIPTNTVIEGLFSYLGQEPLIFNDTILFNITGKSDLENIDDGLLKEAISFSGIDDIFEFSGYSIMEKIEESGGNLSGGQRQRIALARAIYLNSPVIILDEPTSALDKSSEKKFIHRINQIRNKKTIILVSHSPEFISICDRVIDISNNVLKEN